MSAERILVVEDERITARDLQATLQALGYAVPVIAQTAPEAVAACAECRPDLVLMDIRLDGGPDGISAAERIRRQFDIPVVYLTAYADPETVRRAAGSDAHGYLLKPYSEQELHTNIQLALYKARADRAVRESEERFRKLVENASDMITVLDASGTITYKGPSVRRVLGYRPDELVGRTLVDVVHPDDHEQTLAVLRECLQAPGDCRPTEYRMRHKNGEWRVMEARGRNLVHDPAVRGLVINSRDITDRKESEERIRAARQEAERAGRAKIEMLSRTSHELRTPMNAILGFAQLLELDVEHERDREAVAQILQAGRHLLRLIDELLEVAEAELGRLRLVIEPVPVAAILDEALEIVRPLAVQLQIRIPERAPVSCNRRVRADSSRLRQVLVALLSNAVKFNRPRGIVEIACRDESADRLRLAIRDTGRGLEQDTLAAVFEPFERAGAEQAGIDGVGLGLALSRSFLHAMGGEIGAESTQGSGSTFWIELQLAENGHPEAGALAARSPGAAPG